MRAKSMEEGYDTKGRTMSR